MRTTILVSDHLGKAFQQAAKRRGLSLSAFLVQAGRLLLTKDRPADRPFRLVTHGGTGLQPGVDLDQIRTEWTREDQKAFRSGR